MDRWIGFHRQRLNERSMQSIDQLSRLPQEIPLTPRKYEFLSSQMENRRTFLEYVYTYIHSRLFDTIPFVERVLTYLGVFPRSQRLDPFVYRGAFVAGQIRASFKRYLRRARGRKERTSGLLSWHEIRATPIPLLFLFSSPSLLFSSFFVLYPVSISFRHTIVIVSTGEGLHRSRKLARTFRRDARGNARSYRWK